ncbi:MAG: hypothetical protein JXR94_06630, partial [Candidatus Hydrogenedentes bacterium]|nr:hypothetical protein [Candidatus Hydrogenedentota bacterium]
MKLRILLCLIALPAFAGPAAASESSPLAHWDFDEIVGGVIPDRAGGHDAAVVGELPLDAIQPGIYGMAAYFDNGRWFAQVAPSHETALEDAFTLVCAIKPLSVDGFRTICWKGDRTVTPQAVNYYVDLRDGKVELKTKDAAGKWTVFSTPPAVEAGAWHLVMIAYDAGRVGIWVNGHRHEVSVAEDGERAGRLLANAYALTLGAGANAQGTAYSFWGLIDDIRILPEVRNGFSEEELQDWQRRVAQYDAKLHAFRAGLLSARLDQVAKGRDAALRAAPIREAIAASASLPPAEGAAELERIARAIDGLEFRRFFQHNAPTPDARFIAAPMGAWERAVKRPRFFEHLDPRPRTVRIDAARNEFEGFQVILVASPDEDVRGVKVDIGQFRCGRHRLGPGPVEWGRVHAIRTEQPDIPVDFVGPIPDMIVDGEPALDIERGDFTPVFFRVYVPEDAHAGLYKGTVRFTAGGTAATIPVRLRVHPFTLPERPTLPMAFSFFESFYCDWYGWDGLTADQRLYLAEFLMRYRIPLNNIYSHDYCYPPPAELAGLRSATNFYTSKYYGAAKPLPPDELEPVVQAYAEALDDAKAAGIENDFYVYIYDEIAFNRDGVPAARQFTEALRAARPGVRLMQTSFPAPEFEDLFNVWVPMFQGFARAEDRAYLERLRARGDAIWWYAADAPKHPCPNFFLDYPVFDCRIIGTLSYLHGVQGVLYWSINREWKTNLDIRGEWPGAEWKPYIFHIQTGARKHKNGMGNFVYPGP